MAALNATLERETVAWEEGCRVFEEELAGLAAKLRSARTSFVGGLIHKRSIACDLKPANVLKNCEMCELAVQMDVLCCV